MKAIRDRNGAASAALKFYFWGGRDELFCAEIMRKAVDYWKKIIIFFSTLLLVLLWAGVQNSAAFFQPEYQNRCTTNFLDAYISPGFVYQTFFQHFRANTLRQGSQKAPTHFKLSVTTSLHQFIYISPKKVLGLHPGGEVIIPYVSGHIETGGVRCSDYGLGDIFVAAFLQSDERVLRLSSYELPVYFRLLAGAALPTGNYDPEKAFNTGYNLTTYTFYFATTVFPLPRLSLSARFMYYLHSENSRFGPDRLDLKPGQLFNVHFAASYEIFKNIRLGAMGHYWRQTTDDRLEGRSIRGREQVLALGPGVFVSVPLPSGLLFMESHAIFDTRVRNRPDGMNFQLRIGYAF